MHIIDSRQYGYGYIIGTQGAATAVKTTSTTMSSTYGTVNTAPEDYKEGIGSGATLYPQSLYYDQLERRLSGTTSTATVTQIPGTIPVNAYSSKTSSISMNTSDGVTYAGNLTNGSYMDYQIGVPEAGEYAVTLQLAAGWTDTKNLIDAQLYYYRVIGYFKDADGNLVMGEQSDAAGVVAADGLPEKITNVKATISGSNVTLIWDQAEHARYYKVSRAAGATGKYYSMKYNIETTTYSESSVAANTYRYKVAGYYKDVDSSWVYGELSDTLYVTIP